MWLLPSDKVWWPIQLESNVLWWYATLLLKQWCLSASYNQNYIICLHGWRLPGCLGIIESIRSILWCCSDHLPDMSRSWCYCPNTCHACHYEISWFIEIWFLSYQRFFQSVYALHLSQAGCRFFISSMGLSYMERVSVLKHPSALYRPVCLAFPANSVKRKTLLMHEEGGTRLRISFSRFQVHRKKTGHRKSRFMVEPMWYIRNEQSMSLLIAHWWKYTITRVPQP